ncbi:MAG TPA: sigma-70 family RNA polymerase sigma factor [Verrucomicrobiota bacterium]|nr:sigma-70 family RNA polymerase sigma factor [Verrucomicrobiota bacterium]
MKKLASPKAQARAGRIPAKLVSQRIVLRLPAAKPAAAAPAPALERDHHGIPIIPQEASPRINGARSAVDQYLREISEVPLLTPEQEIELAHRIHQGDARAREHMIRANLRLCVKIARDYEHHGVPLLDLVNEGNIGLMKAVDYFDPAKGAKFSTYSSWWIKQAVKRAVANQSKTIRIPIHLRDRIAQFWRVQAQLQEELGREPSDEEIAGEMDLDERRIRKMRRAMLGMVSLDAQLGDDDSSTVAEVVPDERAGNAYEELERQTRTALMSKLVNNLNARELTILRLRFGLDGGPERTLDDVGKMFNLTRERIRQLQNIALGKLRRWMEQREATPDEAIAQAA